MPKISIVLPVYNGSEYISEAIDSILNQTYSDWELIIVNDCSTDSSLDIIEKYCTRDSRIKVVNNTENQRLPKSLNIGFKLTTGEYLTWTSDDNIYEDSALEVMCNYLENNPDEVIVCAKMSYISEDSRLNDKVTGNYDNESMCVENCVGACFLYKREVLDTIGLYNPECFLVEDYDYWLRILLNYKNIAYIDTVLYRYRMHGGSLTSTRYKDVRLMTARLHARYLEEICEFMPRKKELLSTIFFNIVKEVGGDNELLGIVKNYVPELQIINFDQSTKDVIIYGAGYMGKKCVEESDLNVVAFTDLDNNKVGTSINGYSVKSIEEAINNTEGIEIVVAASIKNLYSMVTTLYNAGLKQCYLWWEK